MADPDLELRGGKGQGGGFSCFAYNTLRAFLTSAISSIFIQNKGDPEPPREPTPRSATGCRRSVVQTTVGKKMATGTFTYNTLPTETLKERIKKL